jgi:cellulose synthase/poly-beta-1,6-N-acetylglucosamine synthase-like glycosyltransferase
MPSITALLHTHNDVFRLGRCLETLYPCDEIFIVDRSSTDETLQVAREYGARIITVKSNATAERALALFRSKQPDTSSNWILCIDPRESLSEALAGSLYEWKSLPVEGSAFSMFVREETSAGWISHPTAQTRLISPDWKRWNATVPIHDVSARSLEGELLRFAFP